MNSDSNRAELARLTEAYLDVAVKLGLSMESIQEKLSNLNALDLSRNLDNLSSNLKELTRLQVETTRSVNSHSDALRASTAATNAKADALREGLKVVGAAIRNRWFALFIGILLGMGSVSIDDVAKVMGGVIDAKRTLEVSP